MNANVIDAPIHVRREGIDEPLYFASGDHQLFGWLHGPLGDALPGTGIVLCKPFGYEAVCSHRSLRTFAEATAARGFPTLRFDYVGTGDSADIGPGSDELEAWIGDILAAVGELRRRTGVERVCLLGFRLGALLATLAAVRSDTVDSLILIAPVIAGKRYVREMRTTRLASLLGVELARSPADVPSASQTPAETSLEVSGFPISANTLASLSLLNLEGVALRATVGALVVDRSDLPAARGWTQELVARGIDADYCALPGFVEMMMKAPQFAVTPEPTIAKVVDWLSARYGELASQVADRERSPRRAVSLVGTGGLSIPADARASNATLTERPVAFGPDQRLFGIVTEPPAGEKRRRAVILLNAGADYHIGASRMYVSLARRWARHGYVVLRMDLAGLGDSYTRPSRPDNEVFPPCALDDIHAAIGLLRTRYAVEEVTLGGLCSGAYHALRAAATGAPVNRIFMVNPQTFFWDQDATLEDVQLIEVVRSPATYRERALSLAHWRKLLAGRVDVKRIARVVAHRGVLTLESLLRDLARGLHIRLPHDLGWELEKIAAHGVRTVMVFARGEPGIELLRIKGGSAVKRLADRCRIHVIDSADHTFSQRAPRAALEEILSKELFAHHPVEN